MSQPTREVFWPTTRNDIHWVIWSGTAILALTTLSREAAGTLSAGISPFGGLLIAAGVLSVNLLLWWWSLPVTSAESTRGQIARGSVAVYPSLILGIVLTGTSTAAMLGVLAIVAIGLASVVVVSQQSAVTLEAPNRAPVGAPDVQIAESFPESLEPTGVVDGFSDPTVNQQIIRRRTDGGHDTLEALLRLEFAADQRELSIHLPIQPAFEGSPQVDCEPLDDTDITLKVAAIHAYGVRIEAKRAGDLEEPASIPIGILIHSVAKVEAAA